MHIWSKRSVLSLGKAHEIGQSRLVQHMVTMVSYLYRDPLSLSLHDIESYTRVTLTGRMQSSLPLVRRLVRIRCFGSLSRTRRGIAGGLERREKAPVIRELPLCEGQ